MTDTLTCLSPTGEGTFSTEIKEIRRFVTKPRLRGLEFPQRRWSTGCAFLDYDRDGHLDLFVANYLEFDLESAPRPGDAGHCVWKGLPVYCGPRGLPGETMSLFHNDGHGRFADVSVESGVAIEKSYYGFTALTGDFDNDDWVDVYVACDSTASLFYRNERVTEHSGNSGLSQAPPITSTVARKRAWGATAGDYDHDGLLDIFKTNFSDDTPTLYKNARRRPFCRCNRSRRTCGEYEVPGLGRRVPGLRS